MWNYETSIKEIVQAVADAVAAALAGGHTAVFVSVSATRVAGDYQLQLRLGDFVDPKNSGEVRIDLRRPAAP